MLWRGVPRAATFYIPRPALTDPLSSKQIWACRFCHNEVKNEKEPDPKQRHEVDRFAIAEVSPTAAAGKNTASPSPPCLLF